MTGTTQLIVILVMAVVVLALAVLAASGQPAHEHGSADEQAMHEKFYAKWQRPTMRTPEGRRYQSCCSKQDCFPTQFRKEHGVWFAMDRDGSWVPVPEAILEHNTPDPEESPDGRGHACITPSAHAVICAVLGTET